MEFQHIPVMLNECIENLNIKSDGIYIDGTAGGGGHSAEIARRLTNGKLYCLDKDPDAIAILRERFRDTKCVEVIQSDFADVADTVGMLCEKADGVLLDLGVSSHQFDSAERGFSYSKSAPLDMRMSQSGATAGDIVNGYDAKKLIQILYEYGEESFAPAIVKKIVAACEKKPIETTLELADIVASALPPAVRRKQKHPAKKTFQALRIEVNGELDCLERGLDALFEMLKPGGRMCVITFHSLEDRIVKRRFAKWNDPCECPKEFPVCICGKKPTAKNMTKKPITASEEELEKNRRAHSAKLRVTEKL